MSIFTIWYVVSNVHYKDIKMIEYRINNRKKFNVKNKYMLIYK